MQGFASGCIKNGVGQGDKFRPNKPLFEIRPWKIRSGTVQRANTYRLTLPSCSVEKVFPNSETADITESPLPGTCPAESSHVRGTCTEQLPGGTAVGLFGL